MIWDSLKWRKNFLNHSWNLIYMDKLLAKPTLINLLPATVCSTETAYIWFTHKLEETRCKFSTTTANQPDIIQGTVLVKDIYNWMSCLQMWASSKWRGLYDLALFSQSWRSAASPVTMRMSWDASGTVINPHLWSVLPRLSSHYHFSGCIWPPCPHC